MSENSFAPYRKAWEALQAVIRFVPALVEHPSDFLALLFIAERTACWQKPSDAVSLRQFVIGVRRRDGTWVRSGCGLRQSALKQALARLEKRGLLIRERRQNKRAADVSTEYRINWQRLAELIKSVGTPLVVKRPPPGHQTTTPLAVKRPHNKHSYSKHSHSKQASLPSSGKPKPGEETAAAMNHDRLAGVLIACWPDVKGRPGPKLLTEIEQALGDTPIEEFRALLIARWSKKPRVESFGLAVPLAREARARWNAEASARKQAADSKVQHDIRRIEVLLADASTPADERPALERYLSKLRAGTGGA